MTDMKLRIAILAAVFAFAGASCVRENGPSSVAGLTKVNATLVAGGLKTLLADDGTSVLWSPGDEISVFYNGDGVKFTALNTKPKATTIFTSEYPILFGGMESSGGADGTMLYGVYPYDPSNAQAGDELVLSVPSNQVADPGTFARGSFPSVGRSNTADIAFYNVCGGLRFSVFQSDIWIVKMKSAGGEALSGRVGVVFDESGRPAVSEVISGSDEVSLMLPGGQKFERGKWYFISLLPATLADGFSIDFVKNEDDVIRRKFTSSVTIKRTTFGSLKNADSDASSNIIIEDLSEVSEEWSL